MSTNDFHWLAFNRDDGALRSSAAWRPVLDRLEASFLPKPSTLEVVGARDSAISSWLDPKVIQAIDRAKESLGFRGEGVQASIGITPARASMSIFFRIGPEPGAIRALFVDVCRTMNPTYARAHLNNAAQALHDRHYAAGHRTFYASGLYWLNFFGADELERQGGAALAQNPHAKVERLQNGLLLEVGGGPLDALTAEGEAKLVEATRAMPPLRPEPPAPASVPATAEPERRAAPITTVGGVRGWLDPSDGTFWVSKHVDPPHPLDARTVRSLAALPGKGKPAVISVHVLFSTREAALANKDLLAAAGIRAFYVSSEDGQSRPA